MPKLVEDVDMYNYLDMAASDDAASVVVGLRDAAEELLEAETNRTYGPEVVLTQEQYDGPGGHLIFTRRPISVLTKIEFRYLPEVVQELYFNLDLLSYVTWTPGKRRIHSRIYPFPAGYNNVLISYTAAADQPKLAVLAIKELVSICWRRRGSEDARSEQKGSFQHSLVRSLDESPLWKRATETLNIPLIG